MAGKYQLDRNGDRINKIIKFFDDLNPIPTATGFVTYCQSLINASGSVDGNKNFTGDISFSGGSVTFNSGVVTINSASIACDSPLVNFTHAVTFGSSITVANGIQSNEDINLTNLKKLTSGPNSITICNTGNEMTFNANKIYMPGVYINNYTLQLSAALKAYSTIEIHGPIAYHLYCTGDQNLGLASLGWYNLYLNNKIIKRTNNNYGLLIPDTTNWTADQTIATQEWVNNSASNLEEIAWTDLVLKRDNNQLVPGKFYRIIDYTCTTITTNTSSANHAFDIIVRADSQNKLNEKASAIQHDEDTYFNNCKLEAWQIWYCLDNDTTRFAWADSTNGKGVIYRMIDEHGNDCPYDFKNILFSNGEVYSNAYTFSQRTNNYSEINDASIDGLYQTCRYNIINKYIKPSLAKQTLNFNVFYCIGNNFNCTFNILKNNCYSNTFNNGTHYNILEDGCYNILFKGSCQFNHLGTSCRNINFDQSCHYNSIGRNSGYINFGRECKANTIGTQCFGINFGNSSSIKSYYQYILIDNGCYYLNLDTTAALSTMNFLQNIHIHSGIRGASDSYKTIIISEVNAAYEINIVAAGTTTIEV